MGRWRAFAGALAAAGVLSACGGGPAGDERRSGAETPAGPTSVTTTATPSSAPTATGDTSNGGIPGEPAVASYADWLNALARHDAQRACALQAPELTIELRYRAILEDRAELGDPCTGFVAILWEDSAFESEIVDVAVTQVTGEDALLAVHLGPAEGTHHTVRMVYHRARWRVSSVEPRTGAAWPDAAGAAAGPERWLDAWCDLSPDLTREQVVGLMGEPSGEYTVQDGGEPQLWWAQDQYDFRAYLDVDGSVLELVGDYDALSAEDRAELPCPELRR